MTRFLLRSPLASAFSLAVAFRLAVFLFALIWPIPGEDSRMVSPRVFESGLDMGYYAYTREVFFHGAHERAITKFLQFYGLSDAPMRPDEGAMIISAPLFPVLLEAFAYNEGNTLPLATLFLLMGIGLAALWLWWLHQRGVPPLWLAIFAVLPMPVWLSLGISTDLPFALLFGLFFVAYQRVREPRDLWLPTAIGVIAALARGNGPLLLVFLVCDRILRGTARHRGEWTALVTAAVVIAVAGVYYLPEFMGYMGMSRPDHAPDVAYFGVPHSEYVGGLFPGIPALLDRVASIALLIGAKILYFVGLRPSYWDIPLHFLMARAAAGVILLPGLLYALLRGDRSHRLLIVLYMLPILAGTSLDRYNFAIQPLLFWYGVLAFHSWAEMLRPRTAATRAKDT